MSGVRFLSTVVAIFITFLWAGYVVNAYQENAASRQLALTNNNKSPAEEEKTQDQNLSLAKVSAPAKETVSSSEKKEGAVGQAKAEKTEVGLDSGLGSDVAKADEMARAASEEFTKHIGETDAKVLKVPGFKRDEKQVDVATKETGKETPAQEKLPQEKVAQIEKSTSEAKKDETPDTVKKSSVRFETVAQKKGEVLTKEVADTSDDVAQLGEEKDQSRISTDKVLARVSEDQDLLEKERLAIADATKKALTEVVDERGADKVDRIESHIESRLSIITASDDNRSSTEHDVARRGKDNSRLSKDRVVVAVNKHQPEAGKVALKTNDDVKSSVKADAVNEANKSLAEADKLESKTVIKSKPVWTVPTGKTPEYSVVEKIERGLDSVAEAASEAGEKISDKVASLGENVKEAIASSKKWKVPTGVTPGEDETAQQDKVKVAETKAVESVAKEIKVAELATDKKKFVKKEEPASKAKTEQKTKVAAVSQKKEMGKPAKSVETAKIALPEVKKTKEGQVLISSQLDDYSGAKIYDKSTDTFKVAEVQKDKEPVKSEGLVKRIINIFTDEEKDTVKAKKKEDGGKLLSRVDKVRFEAIKNLMVEDVSYKFTNAKKGEGKIVVKGRSQADVKLSLYVGVRYLGDATADSSGKWSFTKELFVPQGSHILQAQQMSDSGIALARKSLPFVQKKEGKAPKGYDTNGIGIELGDKALATLKKKLKKDEKANAGAKKLSKKELRELKKNKALAARTPLPVRKTGVEKLVDVPKRKKKAEEVKVAALDKKPAALKVAEKVKAAEKKEIAKDKKSSLKKEASKKSAEKGKNKADTGKKLVKAKQKDKIKDNSSIVAPKYYIVKSGDTLGRIAKRELGKRSAYKTILKLNKKLKSANLIYPGQKLLLAVGGDAVSETIEKAPKTKVAALGAKSLPKKKTGAKEKATSKKKVDNKGPKSSHYVVKSGDSLWKIAAKVYGSGRKYKQLIKLNPKVLKKPGAIKPNTKLRVKAG